MFPLKTYDTHHELEDLDDYCALIFSLKCSEFTRHKQLSTWVVVCRKREMADTRLSSSDQCPSSRKGRNFSRASSESKHLTINSHTVCSATSVGRLSSSDQCPLWRRNNEQTCRQRLNSISYEFDSSPYWFLFEQVDSQIRPSCHATGIQLAI